MGKELWMAMHERMVAEYLDTHPNADWSTAYEATADGVQARVVDEMSAKIDQYRDNEIRNALEEALNEPKP